MPLDDVRGNPRSAHISTRDQLMTAIRSEKFSVIEQDRVAIDEVEAGIRDFVGGDAANLRRPASTTDTGSESSRESSANGINLLIERLAGPSLTQIEKLVSEL